MSLRYRTPGGLVVAATSGRYRNAAGASVPFGPPATQVTVVGTPTSGNTGGGTRNTPFDLAFPDGWAAGDFALLFGHGSATALTLSAPFPDWTPHPAVSPLDQGSNSRLYLWSRVLQAGDTPPPLTPSGAITAGWELIVLRGADRIRQVANSTAANAGSLALPALTAALAGSVILANVHSRIGSGTPPTALNLAAGWTKPVDHGTSRNTSSANLRMALGHRDATAGTVYGGDTASTSPATLSSMIGLLVEVGSVSTTG
ncbi:hypothetical protein [Micromonospora aurantiaca (nom. illeg.)]|uniref:hypothetical protein n=1 Tax=Micromonospora aurantiaca (nom. illeg.) TaxID=47850 RepID=UPI0011A85905|nr:hypothetical protein [Micromonospora aurantiaca]MBC9000453.1 hypothetical protein [Micromonospora aurantiaca]